MSKWEWFGRATAFNLGLAVYVGFLVWAWEMSPQQTGLLIAGVLLGGTYALSAWNALFPKKVKIDGAD